MRDDDAIQWVKAVHLGLYLSTYFSQVILTRLCVYYEMFKVSKILVKNTFTSAKSEYYNKKDQSIQAKSKDCFQCCE